MNKNKTLAIIVLLAALGLAVIAGPFDPVPITLYWDADPAWAGDTNTTVNIYASDSLAGASWVKVASVKQPANSVTFDVVPGQRFYTAKAQNFWGEESDQSNVTSTPPVIAPGGVQLAIRLGR